MFTLISKKLSASYLQAGQRLGAIVSAPTKAQGQVLLLLLGVALLSAGLSFEAMAQGARRGGQIAYNDTRVTDSVNAMLTYLEGSFGALIMVASGIGAIMSAAFGQYRAALGLMVVAVGAFILRSLLSTFFNDSDIAATT